MAKIGLRKIRVFVALLAFISLLLTFLGIQAEGISHVSNFFLHLQLLPALLKFTVSFSLIAIISFLCILLLSFVFGRFYCSTICPLGALQDLIWRTGSLFRKKKSRRFNYQPSSKRILRYGLLLLTLIFWVSGSLLLINLLDPYSSFGKISVAIFRPAFIWLNNQLAFILENFNVFSVAPIDLKWLPTNVLIVSAALFLLIVVLSLWRGRLFCNTLCPAGALMGIFAEKSLFRIYFDEAACNQCRKCERKCKAECIDPVSKTIDTGRCVLCFNCLDSCDRDGIKYGLVRKSKEVVVPEQPHDIGKRSFLLSLGAAMVSLPLLGKKSFSQNNQHPGFVPTASNNPVTPPGSQGYEHFTSACVACYLCVSACPTHVIVPSFFDYGLKGFMQPKLDYHSSFCNFECTRCGEVCPTSAILPLALEQKKTTQIGIAHFIPESCVVVVNGTDCGACSEHCPTKAVEMVPYGSLRIPKVNPNICIGCGACEYACPTSPYKAIYVESNVEHKTALKPETLPADEEKPNDGATEEFPF